ncbi:MAG: DUF4870 domain-containing protein [Lentisphaeraceae bacterium]|nr:DUF4870 domain-containing protein [Lentisphaeraceae bacterium]
MSLADEVKKIHDLLESGAITEAEFQKIKSELLDKDPTTGFVQSPAVISNKDERLWSMLIHLSLLFGHAIPGAGFVVPIVIWQMKKDESALIDEHGKNVVNWLISLLIYFVIAGLLAFVAIGIPLLILVGVIAIVFPILGGIKANEGIVWKYPLTMSFIK